VHGALLDAEILVEVYCELMGGRQRSLIFGEERGPAGPLAFAFAARSKTRPAKKYRIDGEEASAHAQYIAGLGEGAIWLRYLVGVG
jgi:DNA polymerase-3 subunit epsilon